MPGARPGRWPWTAALPGESHRFPWPRGFLLRGAEFGFPEVLLCVHMCNPPQKICIYIYYIIYIYVYIYIILYIYVYIIYIIYIIYIYHIHYIYIYTKQCKTYCILRYVQIVHGLYDVLHIN